MHLMLMAFSPLTTLVRPARSFQKRHNVPKPDQAECSRAKAPAAASGTPSHRAEAGSVGSFVDDGNMDVHNGGMSRPSNREKILEEGLKVVHERGFASSSVRDIVTAAGVPLGSFSNHFTSKDAFGLEIVERYSTHIRSLIGETLRNDAEPPLARLREYIERGKAKQNCDGGTQGCLLGNFAAETTTASDAIRQRLNQIFAELTDGVTYCLEAAVSAGQVPADLDCREIGGFIVSSLQGAMLLCKAERSVAPIERFQHVLFSVILRP